jgi:hypothetical protein
VVHTGLNHPRVPCPPTKQPSAFSIDLSSTSIKGTGGQTGVHSSLDCTPKLTHSGFRQPQVYLPI